MLVTLNDPAHPHCPEVRRVTLHRGQSMYSGNGLRAESGMEAVRLIGSPVPKPLGEKPHNRKGGRPPKKSGNRRITPVEGWIAKWIMDRGNVVQAQAARVCGVHQGTFQRWLKGRAGLADPVRVRDAGLLASAPSWTCEEVDHGLLLNWVLSNRKHQERGTYVLNEQALSAQPMQCLESYICIDRLSFVFDVPRQLRRRFAQAMKKSGRSTFTPKLPFQFQFVIHGIHVAFGPTRRRESIDPETGEIFSAHTYARVDIGGGMLDGYNGVLRCTKILRELIAPFVDIRGIEITRADVAIDYVYPQSVCLLLHVLSAHAKRCEMPSPKAPHLRQHVLNQRHGGARARRLAYDKVAESRDCGHSLLSHLTGKLTVERLDSSLCPPRGQHRHPTGFFLESADFLDSYGMLHLGVIPAESFWLPVFLMARYDGSLNIRSQLRKVVKRDRDRKCASDSFDAAFRHYSAATSRFIPLPSDVYRGSLSQLQHVLDSIFAPFTVRPQGVAL